MSHPEVRFACGNFCSQQRLLHKEIKLLGDKAPQNFYVPKRINALKNAKSGHFSHRLEMPRKGIMEVSGTSTARYIDEMRRAVV